ncbi:MAG: AraC family transcriptional regulator [Tyzzerella sp.]|nr:AraC family transcriptional regulator [Tyzzerella sp.]
MNKLFVFSLYIQSTDIPVTEVAYRCDFNDSAYFVKVFKKYKSITPKKYRSILSSPGK